MLADQLPSYERPPVQEVAVSVQFAQLPPVFLVHFGRVWELFEDAYPRCDVQPPLGPMQVAPSRPMIRFDLDAVPTARSWFISGDDSKLIQLQLDRIAFNWRRRNDAEYPRWSSVASEFHRVADSISQYCARHDFGALKARTVEVTYHNIHPLRVDETPEQYLRALAPDWSHGESGVPIAFRLQSVYPVEYGHLVGSLGSDAFVQEGSAGRELHLQLVATIDLSNDPADDAMGRAAELGRNLIVQSFTRQTTEYAHAVWRLTSVDDGQ